MSIGILHTKDNILRKQDWTVSGGFRAALSDGLLSPRWKASGSSKGFVLTLDRPLGPMSFLALFDCRGGKGEAQITVEARSGASYRPVGVKTVYGLNKAKDVYLSFPETSFPEGIRISIQTVDFWTLEIGEIVGGNLTEVRPSFRSWSVTKDTPIVTNGNWRSKVAEPATVIEMVFPPLQEDVVASIWEDSAGGLQPVVFIPDTTKERCYIGHFTGSNVFSEDVDGFLERSLTFEELRRGLT